MSSNRFYRLAATAGSLTLGVLIALGMPAQAGPGKKGHGHNHQHGKTDNKKDMKKGEADHSGQEMHGGMPGDPAKVTRTILIVAKDTEFNLKKIQVMDGETVRFVIRNKGELLHEFTIGSHEMQKQHQAEMTKMMDEGHMTATKMMPGMEHSHGNSAMIEPGQQAEVVWMFHKGATIEFGCNIPGHYEAGMKGEFTVGSGA